MRVRRRRIGAVIGLLAAGAFILSGPGATCTSFSGKSLLTAANFCFIFDCQNGILGGTINPCSGQGSGNQTFEGQNAPLVFTDCPSGGF